MHNLVIIAAILFAGLGGFIVGARAMLAGARRLKGQLGEACRVMDAQSVLILDLIEKIDPATGAELRAKWENTRA